MQLLAFAFECDCCSSVRKWLGLGWATQYVLLPEAKCAAHLNGTEPRQGSGTCFWCGGEEQLHLVVLFFSPLCAFAYPVLVARKHKHKRLQDWNNRLSFFERLAM